MIRDSIESFFCPQRLAEEIRRSPAELHRTLIPVSPHELVQTR